MPLTFPLTIGGTTFAILVAFSADVPSVVGTLLLRTFAAAAYALVTGITIYAAGHVSRARLRPHPGAAGTAGRHPA